MRCCLLFSQRRFRVLPALALFGGLLLAAGPAAAAVSSEPTSTSHSHHRAGTHSGKSHHSSSRARRGSWRHHGQQAIDADRARQIQEALIRSNYLDGDPDGKWDQRTRDAMQRFQQDNGWQTKVIPDSRALIKLGLGPSHDGLLNPDTAMAPVAPPPAANQALTGTPQR